MNFVISLKNALSRREHIISEFNNRDIDFKFFDAVSRENFFEYQCKFNIEFDENNFTNGEKACFLSHVALWEYCVSNNLKYVAIFEDDVTLSYDCNFFLKDWEWIPNNVDVIKLEKFENKVLMQFKSIKLTPKTRLRLLRDTHLGAAGYILSYKAASKLLSQVSDSIQTEPLDELLFNSNIKSSFLNVYQILPALVMQSDRLFSDGLMSQLEYDRSKRRVPSIKIEKKLLQKILIETKRIYLQCSKIFCKIEFDKF